MASYTKIGLETAQKIFEEYYSIKIISLTPLSLGISNSNYAVESIEGEKYLFKISNDKSKALLEEEHHILDLLKQASFPFVVTSLQNKFGKKVFEFENYFGVVFPYIAGIPPGPSDITCFELGNALGALHSTVIPNTSQIRSYRKVGYGPHEIEKYMTSPNCPTPYRDSVTKLFPHGLETFHDEHFACGIIHGDFYYDNSLFMGLNIACMLDFEQSGLGPYILDLGIAISGTCLEKGRISPKLIEKYLLGYEQKRQLPPNERQNLFHFILIGLLSISLWRIKRFKEGNLDPTMKESYIDLLTRATHFRFESSYQDLNYDFNF